MNKKEQQEEVRENRRTKGGANKRKRVRELKAKKEKHNYY